MADGELNVDSLIARLLEGNLFIMFILLKCRGLKFNNCVKIARNVLKGLITQWRRVDLERRGVGWRAN